MRILSLNTWGGRAGREKLLNFFKIEKDTVDVFCLQEVWSAPYEHLEGGYAGGRAIDHSQILTEGKQEIHAILDNFVPFFRPHFMDNYGLMMFVRKTLHVAKEGEVFVHKHKGFVPEGDIGKHARNLQFVELRNGSEILTIINFHGLWNGEGKTDSDERLLQSENIVNYVRTLQGSIVLCGDFNLLPNTQSLALIENVPLRNLIKEYGITSTRTSFYAKREKFADYVFVNHNVQVRTFEVLPDEVSDHAPLVLEIG